MAAGYLLSAEDRRLIQEFLTAFKQQRLNTVKEDQVHTNQAPEVYIAKLPEGGIPAAALIGTGTTEIEPGSAECDIYKIKRVGSAAVDELIEAGLARTVYNVSQTELTGDHVLVHRDKYGTWIAGASATGGGDGKVRVQFGDPLAYLKDQFDDLVSSLYAGTADLKMSVQVINDTGTGSGSGSASNRSLIIFIDASEIPNDNSVGNWLLGKRDGAWTFFDGNGPCESGTGT